MSVQKPQKIQNLLIRWPQKTVATTAWLEDIDISRSLQQRYLQSGWIESLAHGAYKRPNENPDWQGGLYTLQSQALLPVHAGALTALTLQGYAHYVRAGGEPVFLFSPAKTHLPNWFRSHDWGRPVRHVATSFLSSSDGLNSVEHGAFSIRLAAPERAMLESLFLAPKTLDLVECSNLMSGLANLRPALVQTLLEACSSVKVKRLFLFLVEKSGHQWFNFLDTSNVDLGVGDRTVFKGGAYVAKYGITVPKELTTQ